MALYATIRDLCRERGETITGLEKDLGFARGSLSKIDKNKPSVERMKKLSEHFDLPIEFFYGEKKEIDCDQALSPIEKIIIAHYRAADTGTQASVRKLLDVEDQTEERRFA